MIYNYDGLSGCFVRKSSFVKFFIWHVTSLYNSRLTIQYLGSLGNIDPIIIDGSSRYSKIHIHINLCRHHALLLCQNESTIPVYPLEMNIRLSYEHAGEALKMVGKP